jgi:hypothetical protein
MGISNEHNLRAPLPAARPFGIQVRLKPGDPFVKLIGPDWQKTHWFATASERDVVLADMERLHLYSRRGDEPAVLFERIERPAA